MESAKTPAPLTPLTPLEVVRILRAHNLWRRGRSEVGTDPAVLGKALDRAVELIESSSKLAEVA